jgi:hypothetical protein
VIHGKIPVNLTNPVTFGSILKNVTLTLPENLELCNEWLTTLHYMLLFFLIFVILTFKNLYISV